MKLLCDVISGLWGGELFVYPAQTANDDGSIRIEDYLPMSIDGQKIFLPKASAKELADILLRFANG